MESSSHCWPTSGLLENQLSRERIDKFSIERSRLVNKSNSNSNGNPNTQKTPSNSTKQQYPRVLLSCVKVQLTYMLSSTISASTPSGSLNPHWRNQTNHYTAPLLNRYLHHHQIRPHTLTSAIKSAALSTHHQLSSFSSKLKFTLTVSLISNSLLNHSFVLLFQLVFVNRLHEIKLTILYTMWCRGIFLSPLSLFLLLMIMILSQL